MRKKMIVVDGDTDVQFSIKMSVLNGLGIFKAENKEKILRFTGRAKRYVSNSDAIAYLLWARR